MRIYSVRELTTYIKGVLEADWNLSSIWIRGEISNLKFHSSGHVYLTLKDEASCIKAVMFRSKVSNLKFRPENGLNIIVRGYIGVYERDGQYQLYIDEMQPDGVGALHLAFEQLKVKLEKEGLFDPLCKQTIPILPSKIGIVTSPTGAAIRDLLTVINRRFSKVHIIIAPVLVQGELAPAQIADAIRQLNRVPGIDVIIVGRGGGSIEELWAFNTEVVARSIFASVIPVISAVGHETDFTIADFVADLRAPTPSAAGELVVPDHRDLARQLENLKQRLEQGLYQHVDRLRNRVNALATRPVLTRPKDRIYQYQQQLDYIDKHLYQAMRQRVTLERAHLANLAGKLDALSPLAVLKRGFSMVTRDNQVIASVAEVDRGHYLQVRLSDGVIGCEVVDVETKEE